jgi:hypothetical protein
MNRFLAVLYLSLFVGCANADNQTKSIGVAQMSADGTVILRLRETDASSSLAGEGMFTYKIDNPRYQDILKLLGGMKPGEVKNVAPWPDSSK